MPSYRIDNPTKSLDTAKAHAEKLYTKDNIVRVEDVEGTEGARVEIETKTQVEISSLSISLAKVEVGTVAAADKPTPEHKDGKEHKGGEHGHK